jgi:hypothetical protein
VGTTLPAEQSDGYDISTPAHVVFIHTAAFAEQDCPLTFEHYEGLQRDTARDDMLLPIVGRSDLGTDAWGQPRPAQRYLELTNEEYTERTLLSKGWSRRYEASRRPRLQMTARST